MDSVKFENKVLNIVGPYLDNNERAEFYYGTLFLECKDLDKARMLYGVLFDNMLGDIIMNKVGNEYAIDFLGE